MGNGQRGAAASTEIELLCISGGSFVRFRITRVLIRLFPVLFLAVEIRPVKRSKPLNERSHPRRLSWVLIT